MNNFRIYRFTVAFTIAMLPLIALCQQTLVPYRVGKLWGLSDLQGKLVVQPVYDNIESLDGRHWYITKRNGKPGTLYHGKEVIKPVGHNLRMQDARFIIDYYYVADQPSLGNTREHVYNLRGEKLLQNPVMELTRAQHELVKGEPIYITWSADKDSKVFAYDTANHRIKQLILDHQPGMLSYGYSAEKNELYVYRSHNNVHTRFVITYNKKLDKYTSTASVEADHEMDETKDPGYSINYELSERVNNNYVIKNIEFIQHQGAVKRVIKCQRYKDRHFTIDTVTIPLAYDSIVFKRFVQANGHELYQHTTSPNNTSDLEKIDTLYTYRNYILYTKDGKQGLVSEAHVFDATFDSIRYFQPHSEFKPYFLVSTTGADGKTRKGVVRSDGKIIINTAYDDIIYNKEGGYAVIFILVKDGRYGIAMHEGTIIREPQYDLVTPNKLYYSVNIHHDGKFGYYDINGEFCEPLLPAKAGWVSTFNGTKLLKLTDTEGNLIGYANFNGTVYFRK